MSSLVAKNLAHLAELILDVESKRKLCADLERRIEPLERAQLIVVGGELDRLNQLLELLNQATENLKTLQQADDETKALGVLDELEKILTDVQWELVDNLNEALASKAQLQEQHVRSYDERLAEWPKFTRNLLDALDEANRTRAAVRREKSEITRLDAQVDQAKRAFQEAKYVEVEKLLSDIAESQPVKDKDYEKRLRTETELAKKFIRQADLLLLRSLEDAQRRFPYTVLLRTPSEPGSHGINIQGSSRVARYDRDSWSQSLKDITEAVDRGLHRAWSAQNPQPDPAIVANAAAAPTNNEEARNFTLSTERSTPANSNQDVNQLIKRVGKEMYRLLIPEPMQDYLIDNECSLIITANDLELPYELMSYEDKFLCLERPVARMPMGTAFPRIPRTARTEPKLRFLLIHSDPLGNLPAAKAEIEEVEQSLRQDWQEHIEIEVIKPDEATGPHLNDVLREGTFDVIHYAGHAYFDETDADLSGLLLFDEDYFRSTKGERREQHFMAQKIRRLLEGRPLVFLNACQSTRTANEKQPQKVGDYLQGPAEGLAAAFIYGGALGCIGANWPIYDTAAAKFATTFYSNVIKGYMIGEAMRRARVEIRKQFPDNITWAAFVLYGDPTFRL